MVHRCLTNRGSGLYRLAAQLGLLGRLLLVKMGCQPQRGVESADGYEPWSKVGLLPTFLARDPKYAEVGSAPTDDLETVLEAWAAIHLRMQEYVAGVTVEQLRQDTSAIDFGQGTIGRILQGMAQHDLAHIRDAEGIVQLQVEPA